MTDTSKEIRSLFKELQDYKNSTNNYGTRTIKLNMRTYSPTGVHTGSYGVDNKVPRPEQEARPDTLTAKLGIRLLPDLSADITYPLIDGNASQWLEECEAGSIENTTFTSIKLSPRRLFSYCELANDIVLNPDTDLQAAVTDDMVAGIWAKVEKTMLNEIYSDESNTINYIADYSDLIDLEQTASEANIKNPIYLVSPKSAAKLKGMTTTVFPVYYNGLINNIPVVETPYFSEDEIILADWSKLVLGCWGIDITADKYTKANVGLIKLVINSHWDWDRLDTTQFIYASTGEEPTEGDGEE